MRLRVLDAIWCYFPHFPSSTPERCLCLLQRETIVLVYMRGELSKYPILFSLLNPLEELRPILLHLLSAKSKALFLDEYHHRTAARLQGKHSKTGSPSKDAHVVGVGVSAKEHALQGSLYRHLYYTVHVRLKLTDWLQLESPKKRMNRSFGQHVLSTPPALAKDVACKASARRRRTATSSGTTTRW